MKKHQSWYLMRTFFLLLSRSLSSMSSCFSCPVPCAALSWFFALLCSSGVELCTVIIPLGLEIPVCPESTFTLVFETELTNVIEKINVNKSILKDQPDIGEVGPF